MTTRLFTAVFITLLIGRLVLFAQVSPAEISNPQLKALETKYLSQLVALREAIAGIRFPYTLFVGRYVGLDPKQQAGADTRGLEFVLFHERAVLKISANYNAAFDRARLTKNQRASRVFDEVVAPILRLTPEYFPSDAPFDRFGFEISYHVRSHSNSYDYEGKEILAVLVDKADAFACARAQTDAARQNLVNGSEVYVNGDEFGLALHAAQPFSLEEVASLRQDHFAREKVTPPALPAQSVPAVAPSAAQPTGGDAQAQPRTEAGKPLAPENTTAPTMASPGEPGINQRKAEVEALENRLQPQLDSLGKEAAARYHSVSYAPPSLVVFRDRIYLQMTLRNPNPFDKNTTSIYKRAAQSFDLFLAPFLASLLERAPTDEEIAGFDITVLNEFGVNSQSSPEALEFIFPLALLRQFTQAEITNQDLINKGIVLVNGVRIALDLQRVE